jgi:hypothetical protein
MLRQPVGWADCNEAQQIEAPKRWGSQAPPQPLPCFRHQIIQPHIRQLFLYGILP